MPGVVAVVAAAARHQLVVEQVVVDVERVDIFRAGALVATHTRSREPYAKVTEPSHRAGLLRSPTETTAPSNLAAFGRDLSSYEDVVRAGGTR